MRPPRTALALVGLALVMLPTAACSAGTQEASPTPGSSPDPALTTTSPESTASAEPAADVQRLHLTVKGSSVTGDTGTVDVKLGKPVELTVTSDVADEVHVHGVDIGKDVPAGGTVVIDFTQDAPGRFEVELESRKRVLTRLQVS